MSTANGPWSALVTGGGSGLGQATAGALTRRGARVVAVDLDGLQQRAGAEQAGAHFVPADVTDDAQLGEAVHQATGFGPLRVLVACAGIGTPGRVLGSEGPLPSSSFARVLAVNLAGTFNAVRLAAAAMALNDPEDGDRGVIVMTSSVAAFDGQIGQAAYSASKAGVAGMTLPLARDLARHAIRVMAIAPGMFATPLLAGLPAPAIESLEKQVPHPARLGQPPEFAQLVEHIIDNHMLNGEVIRLDGAIRMAPR